VKLAIAARNIETGQIRHGELTTECHGPPTIIIDERAQDRAWWEIISLPIPPEAYRRHATARVEIVFRTDAGATRFLLSGRFEDDWLCTVDELELYAVVVDARGKGAL